MADENPEIAVEIRGVLRELQKLNRHIEALGRDVTSLYTRIHPHENERRADFFAEFPMQEQMRREIEAYISPEAAPTIKKLIAAVRRMDDAIRGVEYDFRFLRSRIDEIELSPALNDELKRRIKPRGSG